MSDKRKVGEVKSAEELSTKELLKLRYENKEITQSQALIEIALAEVNEFFKSDYGFAATVTVHESQRTYLLEEGLFEKWLIYQYYLTFKDSPSNRELTEAIAAIKALLEFEKVAFKKIYYRFAEFKDKIYIDLGNDQFEFIEISQESFKVTTNPPVKFFRNDTMRPLPYPSNNGDITELKSILNLDEHQFKLWTAFVFGCFNPMGPFPLLIVNGNAGTGKTLFTEVTKTIIDPAVSPVRSLPKTEEDLLITAQKNWLLVYDNLSGLNFTMSDSFCKLAVGIGFARRKLYTNTGESILSAARPVMLNGIDSIAERQDLADRSIVLNLAMISPSKRKSKTELLLQVESMLPSILAFFCNAVVVALRNYPNLKLDQVPRMADFAKWVTAGEEALGFSKGEFLTLYNLNIQEVAKDAIEHNVLVYALVQAMRKKKYISGSASQILQILKESVSPEYVESVKWVAPTKFKSAIARSQPLLLMQGIQYEYKRTSAERIHLFKKIN